MNTLLFVELGNALLQLIDHVAAKQVGGGQFPPAYIEDRERVADALDALAESLAAPGPSSDAPPPNP